MGTVVCVNYFPVKLEKNQTKKERVLSFLS